MPPASALCHRSFHEEFPETLVRLQDEHWKPLIAWAAKTFDVEIITYEGILNTKQPELTILKLGAVVSKYNQFQLAGKHALRFALRVPR